MWQNVGDITQSRMQNLLNQLQRTKLILTGLLLVVAGVVLLVIGRSVNREQQGLIELIPWGELGGILIGAGLLGIWVDHLFQKEASASSEHQMRRLLNEHAPVMRDAVLSAFAADHADLQRVATPEMLDRLISNSLGMRLDDQAFADDIYADISQQAIGAAERWHDLTIDINLTPLNDPAGYFEVTARWEYAVVPKHLDRRFVCLSDKAEYAEVAQSAGDVSPWFFKPDDSVKANDPLAFELLAFAIDGRERTIRRSSRKNFQSYTVSVGQELIDAGEQVMISYTTRTITKMDGNLLFFDIEQPTNNIRVNFDYTGCDLSAISAIDLVPSVRKTRIEHSPPEVPTKTVRVELDGWTFPRAGVAFVWSHRSE